MWPCLPAPRGCERVPAMCKSLRVLLFLLLAAPLARAIEWEVKRFDGRDYVPLKQVAEFYGLPTEFTPENKSVLLTRGKRSLRATQDSRDFEINGVKHVLSFAVIERDGKYWVSRMDLGKTIEPAFRPELVTDLPRFNTVVLDAGHGGYDRGAVSRYEVEKNFSLDVARRVRNELQKAGLKVFMTRNTDDFVDLHERASLANAQLNSIFVSIHFNASKNLAAEGLEIFCVTPRGSPSTEYDELLVRDMVQEFGNKNEMQSFVLATSIYHSLQGGKLDMFDRGVKRARFAVLRLTKMPAVLIEGGFLTNGADARKIANKDWRDDYAAAIVRGILEYKKLVEQKVPPRRVGDYVSPTVSTEPVSTTPTPPPTPTPPKSN